MKLTPEQKIEQIRRPPSLANWVRLNSPRRDETARNITRFVLAKPRHALVQVYNLIADFVTLKITAATLRHALNGLSNPLIAKLGHEICNALLPWLEKRRFEGLRTFHGFNAPFPIGRGIIVPVKPTFIAIIDERLTPVFVIGWSRIPFSDYQKRLFCSIVRRAILTQEGFEESDAVVLFVPRIGGSKTERYVHEMRVASVPDLGDERLRQQFDCFGNGLDDAVPVILKELARRGE